MKGEFGEEAQTPEAFVREYTAEVDKAIETGGFRALLFHPFLTHAPERMQAMEEVVQYLVQKRDEGSIWLARCRDLADWLKTHPNAIGDDPKWATSSWR